jgi:hypothetical protein
LMFSPRQFSTGKGPGYSSRWSARAEFRENGSGGECL